MDELKKYIEQRLKHANTRCNDTREYLNGKSITSHGGRELGYWEGLIHAYLNVLEKIEDIESISKI